MEAICHLVLITKYYDLKRIFSRNARNGLGITATNRPTSLDSKLPTFQLSTEREPCGFSSDVIVTLMSISGH